MSVSVTPANPAKKLWRAVVRVILALIAVGIVAVAVFAGSALIAGLSLPAQAIRLLLPLITAEEPTEPDALEAHIRASHDKGPTLPTVAFRAKFDVQDEDFDGDRLFMVRPLAETGKRLHILYLHGGSYAYDVAPAHWNIVEQLINRTGAATVMPVYPLTPEHDWQPAHAMVTAVYERLVDEVGADNVVIAGNSAGGGFTLALAQQLRDQGRPLPAALVMFSPWLDATLSDPAQIELDQRDPMLSIAALRTIGLWWAGDLPATDPRISPLFGSLDGLPPMALFAGTEDLLYPDSRRLVEKAEADSVEITYFEYRNEFHDWVGFMPTVIPEAGRALDQAAAFIEAHTTRS
jgi:acetyl esterase/lipase